MIARPPDPERWAGLLESERALLRAGRDEHARILAQLARAPGPYAWWEWRPCNPLFQGVRKLGEDEKP